MCVKNVSRERISYVRTREIYVRMISNPRRCSPNKLMILFPQIYLCLMMTTMMMIHDHDHDSMISYSNTITPCFQMFKNFRNLKREMRTTMRTDTVVSSMNHQDTEDTSIKFTHTFIYRQKEEIRG